ncbi:MAG: SH3 domain-containing protein [Chloroflexi bacterium]|nr:SH3 domain-containing protein [Chloroflexota bacterium]
MKTPSLKSMRDLCIAALVMLLMPLGQALAADINVDADCSLQNALLSANEKAQVEPLAACETGDNDDGSTQVDEDGNEIPAGLDTITIQIEGTSEGVITLDGTLTVTSNIVIEGGGMVIQGAGNQIFDVTAGSLTVHNLTMNGGWSAENGGAIAVRNAAVKLVNSVVSGSGANALGGGIYAIDSDLSLVGSAISGNATGVLTKPELPAETDDSGDSEDIEGTAQSAQTDSAEPITWDTSGGGIYFKGEGKSLVIERSGLDANRSHNLGGGLYVAAGKATINNTTISGNAADEGGALYNAGDSRLKHVTAVFNSAAYTGGIVDSATLQLYNSILADNDGGDCAGTLNGLIGNLIRDLSCGQDGLSADPALLLLGGSPAYYLPQLGSPALDAASAEHCLPTDQRGIFRSPEACDIGAAEYEPGAYTFQIQSALATLSLPDAGGTEDDEDDEAQPTPEPAQPPTEVSSTCASMPAGISMFGYQSHTACKVLDASGVGNQTVIDYGFIHAVDVFGDLTSPATACFGQSTGIIILLDAADSPRNIVPLRARLEYGMICADVDRAGTVLLMPDEFVNSGLAPAPAWDLSGCTVTTTAILNLRSESNSGSSIVANVLDNVQLSADMKENNYYRVSYYEMIGWLSSDYLTKSGNC